MKALFQFAVVLALGLAAGFYVQQAYVDGPIRLQEVAGLNKALAPPKSAIVSVEPSGVAPIDEELDYKAARQLASPEAWSAFLAAHGSGVHAQFARAEVEKLLLAEAHAPAAAQGSNGAAADAEATGEGVRPARPDAGTEVAASVSGEASPPAAGASPDAKAVSEAAHSAPPSAKVEVAALTADEGPTPGAAEVSNGAPRDAEAWSGAARPAQPSSATEAAALTPYEVCEREADRLARLGGSPANVARFASELGCERLQPQSPGQSTAGQSTDSAVPAPAAAEVSPQAKAAHEAEGPVPAAAVAEAGALTPDEVCKRDGERLARLRGDPSSDEAQRFAKELGCETLRPQLQRLLESLGGAVPAPAVAKAPNGGSPGAKAEREDVGPAPSPGPNAANASTTAAGIAAAPSAGQTSAPKDSVGGVSDKESSSGTAAPSNGASTDKAEAERTLPAEKAPAPATAEVSNGASPEAKPVSDAAHPAEPPGREAAQGSSAAAAAAAPAPSQMSAPKESAVRGVTDKEIVFGMAGPFSGASRELGRQMKIGVETAFNQTNDAGGINGRLLRLATVDDGYEPARTAEAMQVLYDKDRVFGFIGNVGTPTAAVALPIALDHRALFFGAFSGSNLLRRDPPDRYVFNYRASYAEETDAVVRYLVKVKRIKPKEIVVFAQQDSYGDSGYAGVERAVRSLPGDNPSIVRLNYKRNSVDVQDAVDALRALKGQIKAVVMVAAYRAAAKFIEKTRDAYPSLIYTNVSFVGSTALAYELTLLGPRYASGVIVTQVVPAINSYASIVLKYKEALAKSFPGEPPDYVSFEGYIDADILAEGVKRVGRDMSTEKLVDELEQMHDFDMGLGTPVRFSANEHQGSHKVWGTQLDETGHYQPIDLR